MVDGDFLRWYRGVWNFSEASRWGRVDFVKKIGAQMRLQ